MRKILHAFHTYLSLPLSLCLSLSLSLSVVLVSVSGCIDTRIERAEESAHACVCVIASLIRIIRRHGAGDSRVLSLSLSLSLSLMLICIHTYYQHTSKHATRASTHVRIDTYRHLSHALTRNDTYQHTSTPIDTYRHLLHSSTLVDTHRHAHTASSAASWQ